MVERKALVTLLIGEELQNFWRTWLERSWREYAERHGYELVLIEDFIDDSPLAHEREPHWQKCLILEHPAVQEFDHAVWIDADILINFRSAPCIVAATENGKIGVAPGSESPEISEIYTKAELPGTLQQLVNTGVIVYDVAGDRDFLRSVYDNGVENEFSMKENVPLSYHILTSGRAHMLDPRFNVCWDEVLLKHYRYLANPQNRHMTALISLAVTSAWHNSYFLHFQANRIVYETGDAPLMFHTRGDVERVLIDCEDIGSIVIS